MALVKNVEKKIWDVEQFDVTIRHEDGRDMRGDRTGIPMYGYERMAKNSMTVESAGGGVRLDIVDIRPSSRIHMASILTRTTAVSRNTRAPN